MLRFYVLHKNDNPAKSGNEWSQKVYLCGYYHPKDMKREAAKGQFKPVSEGERLP